MLAIDLGVFHRKAHSVSFKESLLWTIVWMGLAMIFNALIYFWKGPDKALEFLTGYLIELSLSVDNLFVFILIFGYFHVAPQYQHRILFWGIIGALILRVIFIFAGAALLVNFHWMIYLFGGILIVSGYKMFFKKIKRMSRKKIPSSACSKNYFPLLTKQTAASFL